MVKWTNLNYSQRQTLEKAYDEKHADDKPTPPEFTAPGQQTRQLVTTGYSTDLYVRMPVPTHRQESTLVDGSIRLVGSGEHIEIDLPVHVIPKLIDQLQKLQADIEAHNAAVNAHQEARKAYDEAMENYEAERVKAISNRLSSNQWTKEDIDVRADEIPF